ncbi:hypothetical protein NXY11_01830 [Parabacteroides faecis]|uniref:hypothetical protein n=1 Tax=Parabacteroides faecis TaxID=1217282 RepID=UPI002164ECBE|nr:hypothetical protein [Parabacteroides faecis]MCS2894396.1 hypothetical protein [Parabacteroides faecis]UVQ47017.1 hypothetical protein NXY11_01830 [Parabacteroides faecis]
MKSKKAEELLNRSYEGGHVLHENAVSAVEVAENAVRQKAIEAFNEAMIYYTSPACTKDEEALKYFINILDQNNYE